MKTTFVRQEGVVLLVSLVLLLLLTVLALTAARTSTMQLRMAGNSQLQNVAFQAAESGLRHGQTLLDGDASSAGSLSFSGDVTPGIVPKYDVATAIILEPGSSLNAAAEGGGETLVRYQVRIASHGKACSSSDSSCDAKAVDATPRAQHLMGCIVQNIAAPLCD